MIFHFSIVQAHFFSCSWNCIVIFPYFRKYHHIVLLLLYFRLGSDSTDRQSGIYFFVPAFILSIYSSLSFYLLPLFFLSYFILAVPMREYFGKHSCMSSTFPIAILNGTFFFPAVQLQVHNTCSEQKMRNT